MKGRYKPRQTTNSSPACIKTFVNLVCLEMHPTLLTKPLLGAFTPGFPGLGYRIVVVVGLWTRSRISFQSPLHLTSYLLPDWIRIQNQITPPVRLGHGISVGVLVTYVIQALSEVALTLTVHAAPLVLQVMMISLLCHMIGDQGTV